MEATMNPVLSPSHNIQPHHHHHHHHDNNSNNNGNSSQSPPQIQQQQPYNTTTTTNNNATHDDFLEQMLSTLPINPTFPHFPPLHLPSRGPSDSVLLTLPLSLGPGSDTVDSRLLLDPSNPDVHPVGDGSVEALYNGFPGSVHADAPNTNPRNFHPSPSGFGGAVTNQAPASASTGGSTGTGTGTGGQPRQKVRARRGQATDPHSIAERLRRERIAERMKALQELVPNANKTDKASMLDEIIEYVKFLQLQVKVLSMSRLGGAAAVAPHLVADLSSSEGNAAAAAASRCGNGTHAASANDNITVTEQQVAKLMEEDMGSAMQYLQGKGLCLMPISLATAISTATCHSRNTTNPRHPPPPPPPPCDTDEPSAPSVSVLTVQSPNTAAGGGEADVSLKDATSVSHS